MRRTALAVSLSVHVEDASAPAQSLGEAGFIPTADAKTKMPARHGNG
jgi:hypothetical protein